jgi:endonuclease/exonuclease/phosphatase family metal-dependent hydrolase
MIRVVTWNIELGLDVDGGLHALRHHDRLSEADVVLLQEMDHDGTERIAQGLGYDFVYAPGSVHQKTGREFGNAILSPWPLRDEQTIRLPHQARVGGRPRVALVATARIDGIDQTLCCTHTETPAMTWVKRQEQFAALADAAVAFPTELAILGGDFNTASRRSVRTVISLFEDHGFDHVSIDAVTTLRRGGQNFTLDHVFARGLSPVESGVAQDVVASDHWPVWVVLSSDGRW